MIVARWILLFSRVRRTLVNGLHRVDRLGHGDQDATRSLEGRAAVRGQHVVEEHHVLGLPGEGDQFGGIRRPNVIEDLRFDR